ncbi:MAG: hypothetical protein JW839_04820 [Candidatus Lokiarchaeota archaeon]|nr:hypothetical protein [Candidatus Lokiarchaeota archaeon]
MGYCTICGKAASAGVYCDDCRKMLQTRVKKGLVVTKPAIASHQDRRQASASPGRARTPNAPGGRGGRNGEERPAGRGIAVGKDGLPLYCDACGNLLYKDGAGLVCRACGRAVNGPGA